MRGHWIISITNSKGGVGKTTSALNLGAALSAASKKVLLIDNDPQGSLTASLGYTPAEQKRTLNHLLLAAVDYPEDLEMQIDRTIIKTDSGMDLIPCNKRVADAAARLQVMQLSQYNAVGESDRSCEKVMAIITNLLPGPLPGHRSGQLRAGKVLRQEGLLPGRVGQRVRSGPDQVLHRRL